jgi:heat-inducible transcriptional repressor
VVRTGNRKDLKGASEAAHGAPGENGLSQRQAQVLRAMVVAYVGEAAPIGSKTVSHLLPMTLSPASIRTTLSELATKGLVEKTHASSGRIPTDRGLRRFVDELLSADDLVEYERRTIEHSLGSVEIDSAATIASQLLSARTRQLGFVVAPRIDRVVLRHVSLVRLSSDHVLVVLISQTGAAHRRVLRDDSRDDQLKLDRIASKLNERIAGCTLPEARATLAREARALRHRADGWLERVLELGALAVEPDTDGPIDLVLGSRLALLEQPEFHDSDRIRDLFATVETKERLVAILDQMLASGGTRVAFGDEVDEPGLRHCAVVASTYGGDAAVGMLGVIGPSRMDFGRVIPLVDYLSQAMTEKISA